MIAIVLGTRHEIIRISPVIRECGRKKIPFFILHTGQDSTYELDRTLFEELELPEAKYHLDIGSGTHAEQTGRIIIGVEKILINDKPDVVLVEGDTNTVLASVLAAAKLKIPIGHIEAGLRSFDRTMPEEINRLLTDQISDLLFTTSNDANENLRNEGIPKEKIFFVGNVMIDTLLRHREKAKKSGILKALGLAQKPYAVLTMHRPSNVDSKKPMKGSSTPC
jgi:UDP-N-acetylglucosamine 2-epimerase (non-hydrolysing)